MAAGMEWFAPFSPAAAQEAAPLAAAPSAATPSPGPSKAAGLDEGMLRRRIDAILAEPALRGASVGVSVRSLADGRSVYEREGNKARIPASNQKLLVAAAALDRLGPDFRFRTEVFRVGAVDAAGTVRGDLILRGRGDPSLTSASLGTLARAVREAGVRAVRGRVAFDDHYFDDKRLGRGWQWDNEPFAFQAQISALNCDGNVVTVTVTPGASPGSAARVTLEPSAATVRVEGTVLTLAADNGTGGAPATAAGDVTVGRIRGTNRVVVSGGLAAGSRPSTRQVTVEDPSRFAVARFRELLQEHHVALSEFAMKDLPVRRAAAGPDAVLVAAVTSEPLSVLVRRLLKESDNLYAEALLKTLGAEAGGQGSGAGGAGERAVRAFLGRVPGFDGDAVEIYDGSGLSRLNTVTPRNLVALLAWVHDRAPEPLRSVFRDGLPIGGVDGTLRTRFRNTAAAGEVRAKTGSLQGVASLSGYVTTRRGGEPLAFSILINHFPPAAAAAARSAQEAIVLALREAAAPPLPPGEARDRTDPSGPGR
jgi:D-alanyl-D-alanine carboxypeptidase/D-alanyl-D-alanine-endopeptidase (penicillin-binding protein 4)